MRPQNSQGTRVLCIPVVTIAEGREAGSSLSFLPCVPTRANARPPRPSPRRELSCPWRRLTAWKLFSSSRLKTKMTASAQPENLRGVREQMGVRQVHSSGGHPSLDHRACAPPSQPPQFLSLSPWHQEAQLPLGSAPGVSVHPPTFLFCAVHLSKRVVSG